MNTEYEKARDAASEAFVDENEQRWNDCDDAWWIGDLVEETYAEAADWGRAYESPALNNLIRMVRDEVRGSKDWYTVGRLRRALEEYDAEKRAGLGEK